MFFLSECPEPVFNSIGLSLDFMQQRKFSCASWIPQMGFFVGISCGSPIYFFFCLSGSIQTPLQTNLEMVSLPHPIFLHLELRRKNQEISFIGIHKDQSKWSKNSLWFPDFPHTYLSLLRVRHSRQNPVFADETWPKISWKTLLFIHWGSSSYKLSCRNSAKCFL